MANTLNPHLFSIKPSIVICYPFDMKMYCVSNVAVHALPYGMASILAVPFDLIRGVPTCLFIVYQEYNVICILRKF